YVNNSALCASSLGDIRTNYVKLTTANNSALRASSLIDIRMHHTKLEHEYYFGTMCLKPGPHRGINQKAKGTTCPVRA
ncbi:1609_t:CDS:1, partial [Paraglomus brasilianum]